MAFKSVSTKSYDAGKDIIDQVPPEVAGGILLAIIALFFGGTFWFMFSRGKQQAGKAQAAAKE